MEQKPSVGRIVHYTEGLSTTSAGEVASPCRAAIVTDVSVHEVALTVFGYDGVPFAVRHCQHSEEQTENGTWHWPERV